MIKINNVLITPGKFPDGTQHILNLNEDLLNTGSNVITPYYEVLWLYESDEEMFMLMCLVNHIREYHQYADNIIMNLILPFVPNARMDRTHSSKEVFTLKYFAKFINSLKFNKVAIFDVHSNVSSALFDRVISMDDVLNDSVKIALLTIADDFDKNTFDWVDTIIYFPDDGAYKRYKNLNPVANRKIFYGKKVRDWETGKILGLEVYNDRDEKVSEADVKGVFELISNRKTLADLKDNLPYFEYTKDGNIMYVVPIVGKGLWGDIWGYVAVEKADAWQVAGIVMDHAGETPGLGAEIATEGVQNSFKGKLLFEGEQFALRMQKGGAKADKIDYQVDAITGGTKTCDGVNKMLETSLMKYKSLFN